MNSDNGTTDDDMTEKAKQLLLLTDLIDKYPAVVERRVAGLVYLIIAGGISYTTLIYMSIQDLFGSINPVIINLTFVSISLFFSWAVSFKLILPLTQSYPKIESVNGRNWTVFAIWGILAICIVILSLVTFSTGTELYFAPALQLIMGIGFLSNYIGGRKQSSGYEFYTREHLYFAIVVFLSIIPMLIFLTRAYVLLIVADMGGIFVVGIYMLITAERLLLESEGQG